MYLNPQVSYLLPFQFSLIPLLGEWALLCSAWLLAGVKLQHHVMAARSVGHQKIRPQFKRAAMSCLSVSSVQEHRVLTSNPISIAASAFCAHERKQSIKCHQYINRLAQSWGCPLQQKFSLHHLRKRRDIYCQERWCTVNRNTTYEHCR